MVIDNTVFEIARKNIDNSNIIKFIGSKYSNTLDKSTLKTCGDLAIWKCLQKHDGRNGRKFTSSLCNFMTWECLNEISFLKRNKGLNIDEYAFVDKTNDSKKEIDELLLGLPARERGIIRDRFIGGFSLNEISRKYGYSRQWIRILIQRSFEKMKDSV